MKGQFLGYWILSNGKTIPYYKTILKNEKQENQSSKQFLNK
jgi:hypothetical protein